MLTKDKARAELDKLIAQYHDKDKHANLSEADVIHKYIEKLFQNVLGWDIDDSNVYRKELPVPRAGRVDGLLQAQNGARIYIEAKKFGIINTLRERMTKGEIAKRKAAYAQMDVSRYMSDTIKPDILRMGGVDVSRTKDEQQAINYAFESGYRWAVLSNFERFYLFNARRDWLVLAFESPAAYREDFDLLWELSAERVDAGSLELLNNQRHREDVDPNYLALISDWRESLAQDILLHPDNNPWAFDESGDIRLYDVRSVVQRIIDRLVIIRFAEDHLAIPADTLRRTYEMQRDHPYTFELYQHLDEFFRGFDRHHNSALFAYGLADKARFSDDALGKLIEALYLARYRAMPADILGNTYEQYLGKALVDEGDGITTRDNLETRKKQGSYYTPQVIVRYLVDHSLGRYLYGTENGQPDGVLLPDATPKTYTDIATLRVLDSACGSGSFLINAYYVLAKFYEGEIKRIEGDIQTTIQAGAAAGKDSMSIEIDVAPLKAELARLDDYPTIILERHLYGTDLDPQAAEIAVVNLMMRAMERRGSKQRLPLILNQNVKVGNALIGAPADDERLLARADDLAQLRALRAELIITDHTTPRHDEILRELERIRADLYALFVDDYDAHFSDPQRARPFHWGIEFPEVFYDEAGAWREGAGFDVIVGNPPYGGELSKDEKEFLKNKYTVGSSDTAALFIERTMNLLNLSEHRHGFIVPKSLTYSSRWDKVRALLLPNLEQLIDCGRVWDDVKLEQIIYIISDDEATHSYKNLKLINRESFQLLGDVSYQDVNIFEFFINDVSTQEIALAYKMRTSGGFLGDVSANTRGDGLQNDIVDELDSVQVIAGKQVQPYYVNGVAGYIDTIKGLPKGAIIQPNGLLVQNIVAHVQKPTPHIRIAASVPTDKLLGHVILDTVNQIIPNAEWSNHFITALLNSKLINWYVYRFIFAKAIRTMHFDSPVTNRIPLPNRKSQQFDENYQRIVELSKEIAQGFLQTETISQARRLKIDRAIFALYELTDEEIELVEKNMP